ncbi:MAG TPA: LLM class F420-dependent oxidoreductase [Acidimicrobiales bacterium]
MRLGVFVDSSRTRGGAADLDAYVEQVRRAADAGFASVWTPQVFGLDALTMLTIAGREVPGVELGTAVVPIYGRHPMHLGLQAINTQIAVGGRLSLGIGLSHQVVVENMWGLSFDKPARFMREYLEALLPFVRDGKVAAQGEVVKAAGEIRLPDGFHLPVLVAGLGPVMLAIAGRLTEGTVTWMTGPQTIADHIVPSITKAATEAGRPAPRVVAALPTCVTDDIGGARERAAKGFQIYGVLPSYRAMLDREGAAGPGDVAIVGSRRVVQDEVKRMVDNGATEFVAVPFENVDETLEAVAALL